LHKMENYIRFSTASSSDELQEAAQRLGQLIGERL